MKPQEIISAPPGTVIALDAGTEVRRETYGRRAADLARLTALGLPVPPGVALSFAGVAALAAGGPMPEMPPALAAGALLALRCSPEERAWGGASAMLNIGLCDRTAVRCSGSGSARPRRSGSTAASCRASPTRCTGWTPRPSTPSCGGRRSSRRRSATSSTRCWRSSRRRPTTPGRRTRPSSSTPRLAPWPGRGTPPRRASCARPRARRRAPASGWWCSGWRWASGPGSAARGICSSSTPVPARRRPSATSGRRRKAAPPGSARRTRGRWRRSAPRRWRCWRRRRPARRAELGDACQLEFAIEDGAVAIVDALPVRRNARAAVRIAVDLANAGVITRREALLRIEPRSLIEHLHPQIDPAAARDVFARGLAASPGAATGRIVFTAEAAQARGAGRADHPRAARDQPGGHPRHARRARRPDGARRHVEPCRGDRPRPRAALRRRRRRAPPRPGGADADHAGRPGAARGRADHRSTAPAAR